MDSIKDQKDGDQKPYGLYGVRHETGARDESDGERKTEKKKESCSRRRRKTWHGARLYVAKVEDRTRDVQRMPRCASASEYVAAGVDDDEKKARVFV